MWGGLPGAACLSPSLTSVLTLPFSLLLRSVNSVGPLGGKLCLLCAHPSQLPPCVSWAHPAGSCTSQATVRARLCPCTQAAGLGARVSSCSIAPTGRPCACSQAPWGRGSSF